MTKKTNNPLKQFERKTGHEVRYIGDGAYVGFNGFHLVLMTYDGYHITNEIFLEPGVLTNLNKYNEEVRK
jgi:hypothetical protein